MTPWKIMREVSKPVRGFEYECVDGHRWFVAIANWENRGNNGCQECGALAEAAAYAAVGSEA